MPIASLAAVSLHYEWSGSPAAPVVVLSNSLGTDLNLWEAQLEPLGRHFRVLRYDTRGHGGSSVPPGPYSLEALGNDVLQLLDFLGIAQASFCGISLGGITALWLAIHAPDRILSIVAADTAARIGDVAGWNSRIEQVERQGMESLVDGTLQRWFTPAFRALNSPAAMTTRRALATTSAAGYAACCGAIRDTDLTSEVASIRIPALIVTGLHDPVTPPSDGRFLEAHIAGSTFVELDAAHLSNVEAADGFNRAVLEFLGQQGKQAGAIDPR